MKIFVVIPAWNEEERIGPVLESLISLPYKIVVVDDGSSDQTYQVVSRYPVSLLRHKIHRIQGAALQTGNDYALSQGADIIVHFDADGQFLVKEIKDIVQPILDGQADIVFGSRFLGKKSDIPAIKEKIYFPIARLVNRILFGIKSSDPQSGFRAMTRATAQKIRIEQDDFSHCTEIMAKAFEYKLRIKEVPITVVYHRFGQNLSGGIKIVKDLLFSKIIK